jgi:hypothetical protein
MVNTGGCPVENDNEKDSSEVQNSYRIDLDWYDEQGRSFTMLAVSRLCQASKKKKIPKSSNALFTTIRQCCAKREDYIVPSMPLQEMIFRLLLANGNQPLTPGEIKDRLEQALSSTAEPRDLSVSKLKRVIDNDRFYGLKAVPAAEAEEPATAPESP